MPLKIGKKTKKRYSNKNIKLLYQVWNKLLSRLPNSYNKFVLSVSADEMVDYALHKGAMAEKDHIIVGMEFVNQFPYKEALGFMLGHELGHQVLGHCGVDYGATEREEWDADMFGVFTCELLKYNMRKVLQYSIEFEKWRLRSIDSEHRKSHGTGKQRNARLRKQLEYLGHLKKEGDE